jgi:hypothetical protein
MMDQHTIGGPIVGMAAQGLESLPTMEISPETSSSVTSLQEQQISTSDLQQPTFNDSQQKLAGHSRSISWNLQNQWVLQQQQFAMNAHHELYSSQQDAQNQWVQQQAQQEQQNHWAQQQANQMHKPSSRLSKESEPRTLSRRRALSPPRLSIQEKESHRIHSMNWFGDRRKMSNTRQANNQAIMLV